MENYFRKNKEDILLDFKEDSELAYLTEEDKKHYIQFDKISECILKDVPKQNKKYVKKELKLFDRNFLDYVCYYKKYYRNGFVDDLWMYEFIEKSPLLGLFYINLFFLFFFYYIIRIKNFC